MKTKSTDKKEKNKKPFVPSNERETEDLTIDEINALIEKYKNVKAKPTIIGKEPYDPFLVGVDENWMSVGDKLKED